MRPHSKALGPLDVESEIVMPHLLEELKMMCMIPSHWNFEAFFFSCVISNQKRKGIFFNRAQMLEVAGCETYVCTIPTIMPI